MVAESFTETLAMTIPTSRALACMLAVFAEFEREIMRERVKASIVQARATALGRPKSAAALARKSSRNPRSPGT